MIQLSFQPHNPDFPEQSRSRILLEKEDGKTPNIGYMEIYQLSNWRDIFKRVQVDKLLEFRHQELFEILTYFHEQNLSKEPVVILDKIVIAPYLVGNGHGTKTLKIFHDMMKQQGFHAIYLKPAPISNGFIRLSPSQWKEYQQELIQYYQNRGYELEQSEPIPIMKNRL